MHAGPHTIWAGLGSKGQEQLRIRFVGENCRCWERPWHPGRRYWMTPFPGCHDPEIQDKPEHSVQPGLCLLTTPEIGYLHHLMNDTLWPRDHTISPSTPALSSHVYLGAWVRGQSSQPSGSCSRTQALYQGLHCKERPGLLMYLFSCHHLQENSEAASGILHPTGASVSP